MTKNNSFVDNALNQPSKFRTRNWVEINYDARETYGTSSHIRFRATILISSLCVYSDAKEL